MDARVTVEDQLVDLAVSDGRAFIEGEFSGRIDLTVTVKPPAHRQVVVEKLRLRIPGSPDSLSVVGSVQEPTGVTLTFHSAEIVGADCVPVLLEVLWAEDRNPLGTVRCTKG